MASYAGTKGKTVSPSLKPSTAKALPALSDAEMEAIAGRVRLVKQHMPEAFDFMKELHAEGLIDGMRGLVSVTVFEGDGHGNS